MISDTIRRRFTLLVSASVMALGLTAASATGATFHGNGPIANGPGNDPNGPGLSVASASEGTQGYAAQKSSNNRVADDFTVTDPAGWQISGFELYAYQVGSGTTSTITEANIRIWNGPPDLTPSGTGPGVVFGDTTTNRLVGSTFSGVYRVTSTDLTNTTRPIMRVTAAAAITLPVGTYWLDVQYEGSLAGGPFQPPVVLPAGDAAAGNAVQSVSGGAWTPMLESATAVQKRVPFNVLGTPDTAIIGTTVNGNTAKATFTGLPAGLSTSYECRVDGAGFASCPASGGTFPDLTAGQHTLQVRSLIGSDPDPSPASHVVTVTNPTLTLAGKKTQKLGATVRLTADCDRACTAKVAGKLKLASGSGGPVTFTLKSVTVRVAADGTRKVKLKLTKPARQAAAAALARGAKVTVKVSATARDSAGNASARSKQVVTLT